MLNSWRWLIGYNKKEKASEVMLFLNNYSDVFVHMCVAIISS